MAERIITYAEAEKEAIQEEMRRDERVFCMGEDIRINVWGVTRGLTEEFGPERILQTPMSESGFVAAAVGAAMTGMRPVVEIMYGDFMLYAADSVANQAAKYRYMCGGDPFRVPLVIRVGGAGVGTGMGCHHAQSLEATFIHYPGLKIVCPTTPYEAKGLLKSAIRDDNPVLVFEHKLIYGTRGPVPEEEYLIPLGKAEVKREGNDITVVSYLMSCIKALEAAKILEKENISLEIIDPRSLLPLDEETIFRSLEKTGRLMIIEEGTKTGGVGAEIAAVVAEKAIHLIDAPITRVAGADCILPSSYYSEPLVVPQVEDIAQASRNLMAY